MNAFIDFFRSFSEMTPIELLAQAFGMVGLVIMVLSYQCKSNRSLFIMQLVASALYVANFSLIGAWAGSFFNFCGIFRCILFLKNSDKKWKLVAVEIACLVSFILAVIINHSPLQILLTVCALIALAVSTVFMWLGDAKKIRYGQIFCASPLWIVHNIFNLSIGGILCECFNIVSSIIFLIRSRKKA
jgi:hypothetical protein